MRSRRKSGELRLIGTAAVPAKQAEHSDHSVRILMQHVKPLNQQHSVPWASFGKRYLIGNSAVHLHFQARLGDDSDQFCALAILDDARLMLNILQGLYSSANLHRQISLDMECGKVDGAVLVDVAKFAKNPQGVPFSISSSEHVWLIPQDECGRMWMDPLKRISSFCRPLYLMEGFEYWIFIVLAGSLPIDLNQAPEGIVKRATERRGDLSGGQPPMKAKRIGKVDAHDVLFRLRVGIEDRSIVAFAKEGEEFDIEITNIIFCTVHLGDAGFEWFEHEC
jgi:hypothetical protein